MSCGELDSYSKVEAVVSIICQTFLVLLYKVSLRYSCWRRSLLSLSAYISGFPCSFNNGQCNPKAHGLRGTGFLMVGKVQRQGLQSSGNMQLRPQRSQEAELSQELYLSRSTSSDHLFPLLRMFTGSHANSITNKACLY